ncbi:hepatocyte nuclear factor 6 isoform X3 [Cotesia glomerata]|uniref:hepatocyte nuclear factor 6 isoform X3 n=1 Tax=Cotesia glomerata TaxID=32391 RepID=UPI001D001AD8|nr:hepatocyte nuclear factor 6 isoform X3 [Cotesia glomerata]XP_044580327.1 hepatocyte nuclear factor 6 isoform X3 [Cotesia glomerata]
MEGIGEHHTELVDSPDGNCGDLGDATETVIINITRRHNNNNHNNNNHHHNNNNNYNNNHQQHEATRGGVVSNSGVGTESGGESGNSGMSSSASQSPDIGCASIPLELLAGGALGVKEERDLAGAEDLSSSQEPPGRPHARESLSVIVPPQDVDCDSRDGDSELLSPGKLTPTSGISVSVASMIDATDFRSMQPEPTYQTLTSVAERMSPPGFSPGSSYATLTPLQPLPPISTMSDKFVYGGHAAGGVSGSFAVMQNNGLGNIGLGMGSSPYTYDKLPPMGMSPPHNYPSPGAGLQPSPLSPQSAYSQSGLNSPHKSASPHYEPAFLPRLQQSPAALSPPSPPVSAATSFAPSHHSPPTLTVPAASPPPIQQQQIQQQQQNIQQTISHSHVQHTSVVMKTVSAAGNGATEVEEINTKELAQRISAELKRYSIPQAIFAQRVLCRSQGTLSDLLRNPKPWSKLKSGRETFRRMWKWLQEPEFQRMSALRIAALSNCSESGGDPDGMLDIHHPGSGIETHHQQFHNSYDCQMRNVNVRSVNSKRRKTPSSSCFCTDSTTRNMQEERRDVESSRTSAARAQETAVGFHRPSAPYSTGYF